MWCKRCKQHVGSFVDPPAGGGGGLCAGSGGGVCWCSHGEVMTLHIYIKKKIYITPQNYIVSSFSIFNHTLFTKYFNVET